MKFEFDMKMKVLASLALVAVVGATAFFLSGTSSEKSTENLTGTIVKPESGSTSDGLNVLTPKHIHQHDSINDTEDGTKSNIEIIDGPENTTESLKGDDEQQSSDDEADLENEKINDDETNKIPSETYVGFARNHFNRLVQNVAGFATNFWKYGSSSRTAPDSNEVEHHNDDASAAVNDGPLSDAEIEVNFDQSDVNVDQNEVNVGQSDVNVDQSKVNVDQNVDQSEVNVDQSEVNIGQNVFTSEKDDQNDEESVSDGNESLEDESKDHLEKGSVKLNANEEYLSDIAKLFEEGTDPKFSCRCLNSEDYANLDEDPKYKAVYEISGLNFAPKGGYLFTMYKQQSAPELTEDAMNDLIATNNHVEIVGINSNAYIVYFAGNGVNFGYTYEGIAKELVNYVDGGKDEIFDKFINYTNSGVARTPFHLRNPDIKILIIKQ